MTKLEPIPYYNLYGEQFTSLASNFVHLENIASRSKDLSWQIKPHRHSELAQIICVLDNTWDAEIDDRQIQLAGSWLMVIPPGVVHGFKFAPNTRGWVLSIDNEIFGQQEIMPDGDEDLDRIWSLQVIEFIDSRQVLHFERLLLLLEEELQLNLTGDTLTVGLLLKLLFITIARQKQLDCIHNETGKRETRLLFQFRELVEQHYKEQLSVKDYAEKLYISVSTLTRVCKQHLQQSPKKVVRQRIHSEAKRRLLYTRQNIEVIALELGYSDAGYFCRQFKNLEGVTAGEFRQCSQM